MTSLIDAALQSEVLDLCYRIAPELKGFATGLGGLYLLDSADLAAVRREPTNCLGYATPYLGIAEREHLIESGQFKGAPSGVIVFCTDAIREAGDNFNRCLLEVALHEICHLLPAVPEIIRSSSFGPKMTASIEEGHRQLVECPLRGKDEVLKDDHGDRFIRIAAHVWFRSVALGILPAAHHMFAGWKYKLSHPHDYLESLGNEPLAMMHEDFTEIQKTPAPEAFTDLWQSDLEKLTNDN